MYTTIPFLVMGITSMLLQITVLRLLLSTFSGNELDIGITLSFWLICVGLGSYIGRKVKLKHALAFSFISVALLCQPTALAIRLIRPALALEPGEIVSLTSVILATAASLLPLCFIIGIQFPLAVSYSGMRNAAGRVYGLEALGAFTGGLLFTFVISSRVNAFELCLLLSFLNILTALYISGRKTIVAFLILPLFFYFGFYRTLPSLSWPGMKVSQSLESRYGEISVVKVRDQSSVYANGHLLFSYPDSQSEEMNTHLPMTLHPSPSKILIIGGSPGTLKELLKYPVKRIDFVELDPKIVDVFMGLPAAADDIKAMRDKRVRIVIGDGRRYIKSVKDPSYDLVVLSLPQPSTASVNRFYTTDFFGEVRHVLKQGGVLSITVPQSTGYIGRRMQTATGSIYDSLARVFSHIEVTAQEYGGLFASDSAININPEILAKRFSRREIHTKYFSPYIFYDAFSLLNTGYVKQRLGEIETVNTDLHPSAYLYNLMLWAEVHGGKALYTLLGIRRWQAILAIALLLAVVSFASYGKKKRAIYFSVFTTGFAGMSFVLSVILVYQSLYGYVYEMIGILSATFMIGLWTGTTLIRHIKKPLTTLFILELATIVLAFVASVFFRAELLFYALILISGIITGSQFSAANASMNMPETGGKLYAFDLIGSFIGALVPSVLVIPLFGIYDAMLLIAFVKFFSASTILSAVKSEKSSIINL
jgi:spermidine synthase